MFSDFWLLDLCLCVDQVVEDEFLGAVNYAVHGADPCHLVGGLELLGDALCFGHLGGQKLHHLIGLAVHFLQMGVQPVGQKHSVEDARWWSRR